MATQFYLESFDRPNQSGVANESIEPGTLVTDNGAGVNLLSFADDDYTGLALYDPEYLSAEDEDAIASGEYEVDDRVKYHPSEDAAVVKIRTPTDDGGAAPSISHGDIVGVVDESAADAPVGVQGRIVEEGYQADGDGDGASTTFSRDNDNFLAIGRAYRPAQQNGDTVTGYDAPVRVVLFSEAQA